MRALEEELRRTRAELRSAVDHCEVSLDELKASNQELHVITEELRSAAASASARHDAEGARQASEERWRLALRSAPIVVVSFDAELRILWSYAPGKELGADGAPDRGDVLELFAPGHAERFFAIARDVLRAGDPGRAELELRIGGEPRTYDLRFDPDDSGLHAVGFDITPSKLAEASLREADRRKDEFLATLSHELRNPLTPLKVALEVAKLADGDPAKLAHALGIVERQAGRLGQLVDDLLDLSRITQGKLELDLVPLDPVQVVEAALEATRPLFEQRQHQLTLDLPDTPHLVLGDHSRLTQVLVNLLNNAAKYTPARGHVALGVHAEPAREVLLIRVSDDGAGIASDMLPRIFEIFVQSRDVDRRAHDGLGIGLNLVRRLVELHGGSVSASSPGLGRGSHFIVELPMLGGRSKPS